MPPSWCSQTSSWTTNRSVHVAAVVTCAPNEQTQVDRVVWMVPQSKMPSHVAPSFSMITRLKNSSKIDQISPIQQNNGIENCHGKSSTAENANNLLNVWLVKMGVINVHITGQPHLFPLINNLTIIINHSWPSLLTIMLPIIKLAILSTLPLWLRTPPLSSWIAKAQVICRRPVDYCDAVASS